ncbi:transcription antitermination factor NusB [Alicyclobacillus tolerans]|uniref:transcription antitermination factor NusB n=1 Tax=Alicyclobacillus tolerans TaxID=90970 RepID=UPI003B7FCFE8
MTRHEARVIALQSLYQIEIGQAQTMQAIAYAVGETKVSDEEMQFIQQLVFGVVNHQQELDELLVRSLENWSLDRLGKVELCILRLSGYELVFDNTTEVRIVINEAVELGKEFGAENSGKFINGVLAKLVPAAEAMRS